MTWIKGYGALVVPIYGRARRADLLRRAANGRIWLNCEGGIAADDRDLRILVRRGLLRISRTTGTPKWSPEFRRHRGKSFHGTRMIRRSYAELAGRRGAGNDRASR